MPFQVIENKASDSHWRSCHKCSSTLGHKFDTLNQQTRKLFLSSVDSDSIMHFSRNQRSTMHAIIRFAASTCLQIVFAILACNSKVVAQLENQTPTETITPFDVKVDQRLEKLRAFRITREIDRSELVSPYRSLLDDASTATQRSKIMLELAVVYEIRAQKGKYTWDMDKAIKWYRKSYEVTPSTSRQRVVAANRLAQRLQRRRKPGDIAFSREILDAVVDEFDQLSLNGKLELNLLTQERSWTRQSSGRPALKVRIPRRLPKSGDIGYVKS